MIRFLTRRIVAAHHREIGRLGGQARARQMRAPIRQRTIWLREQLGLPADGRLA